MPSVSIKPVALPDLEDAVALFEAQLRKHDISSRLTDLRDVTRKIIADPSEGFVLLAVEDGTAAGVAYAASHLSIEHGGIIGWLEELYVQPECRGAGIGSRLLTEVIARAQKLNWRGLELEVVAGHERVVPLYLRHGFQPASRARFSRIFSNHATAGNR